MGPEDMIEDVKHIEIKDEKEIKSNIGDILEGDIDKEDVIENQNIDTDDFSVESIEEIKKDPPVSEEKKKEDPAPVENKPAPVEENDRKQGAVTRLMKTDIFLVLYNSVARRVGKIANPKNPECLAFDKEDSDDINVILEETVKEEKWSGFPSKWLLLIIVSLIIVGKIFSWNKKTDKKIEAGKPGANDEEVKKLTAGLEEQKKVIDELKEQNRLLQGLLDKKVENGKPNRFYKHYDLEEMDFSDNGAIIDKSKAGQKGYTPEGKKMGQPSHEERILWEKWKLYHEHLQAA